MANDTMTKVYCNQPNVWTTKGKLLLGESVLLGADEIKSLGKAVTKTAPVED